MPFHRPTMAVSESLLNGNHRKLKQFKSYMQIISLKNIEGVKQNYNFIEEYANDFSQEEYPFISDDYIKEIKITHPFVDGFLLNGNVTETCSREDVIENAFILYDEERLELFLTKLFCLSEFNHIKNENDLNQIISFHRKNQYLFKLFNSKNYEKMDKIIRSSQIDLLQYQNELKNLFKKMYTDDDFIKIVYEIKDLYKDYINIKEVKYFNQIMDDFYQNIVSKKIILYILRNNLYRFNIDKVYDQTIFESYPRQLSY